MVVSTSTGPMACSSARVGGVCSAARRGRSGLVRAASASPASKPRTGWAPGLTDLPSKESLKDYIRGSDGPPRVFSPLPPNHEQRNPSDLPLLLVLPGIDGTGYTAASQFETLAQRFDLKTFLIPVEDRTPLDGLVRILREYLEVEVASSRQDRPIYVMGESFGGMLALLLAQDCGHLCLNRVVLVNPATSFGDSIWAQVGDVLPSLPAPAYEVLPFAISPLLGNPFNLARRRVDETEDLPSQAVKTVTSLFELMPVLDNLKDILPPDTLKVSGRRKSEESRAGAAVTARPRQVLTPSHSFSSKTKTNRKKNLVEAAAAGGGLRKGKRPPPFQPAAEGSGDRGRL